MVTLKAGARASEADLCAFVAERLAAFKVVFWTETLPRNADCMILKTELRKLLDDVQRP